MRIVIIIVAISMIALWVGAIEATKAVAPVVKRIVL